MNSWKLWGKTVKAPKTPTDYQKNFELAEFTFKHQWVYDPDLEKVTHLHSIPEDTELSQDMLTRIGL
jgi:hypothetical protein